MQKNYFRSLERSHILDIFASLYFIILYYVTAATADAAIAEEGHSGALGKLR